MNRIEEIKEQLKKGKYDRSIPPALGGVDREASTDIRYLLSQLEIAEKVLEKVSVPMPGSRDNELVLYYERIATEALKQLRED